MKREELLGLLYSHRTARLSANAHLQKAEDGNFPPSAVVKNPPANAGDTGSSPGLGRSHMPRSN